MVVPIQVDGVSRVRGFIHSIKYTIDRAITDSAKAAYLAACIKSGNMIPDKYSPSRNEELRNLIIPAPINSRLNRLKRQEEEAETINDARDKGLKDVFLHFNTDSSVKKITVFAQK